MFNGLCAFLEHATVNRENVILNWLIQQELPNLGVLSSKFAWVFPMDCKLEYEYTNVLKFLNCLHYLFSKQNAFWGELKFVLILLLSFPFGDMNKVLALSTFN